MVVKVAVSTINSDKLIRNYDDLYVGVAFWDAGYVLGYNYNIKGM